MFAREREQVRAEHAARQARDTSPTLVEHSLVGRVGQHMLRRVIQLVRGARHGGMILVANASPRGPGEGLDGLRLKYRTCRTSRRTATGPCSFRSSTRRGGHVEGDGRVGGLRVGSEPEPGATRASGVRAEPRHRESHGHRRRRGARQAIRAVGFGAEVSAELPSLRRASGALDTEGAERKPDDIENVGTRHRAAYRFVQDHPDGLAIVISHDGGVSFVANREQRWCSGSNR